MESCSAKRQRSVNYSLEEKNLLMTLANEYKHIVENKKTDAYMNAEKEKVWEKICTEFNAISPNNVYRDKSSLKKTYINVKTSVRKEVAEEKINILKTGGGGPSKHIRSPLTELTLETVNTKTVFGLQHDFDSDKLTDTENVEPEAANVLEEGETIYIECEEAATEVDPEMWSKWKSSNIKQPISSPLKRKSELVHTPSSSSKRRPVAAVAHSSNIAKIYADLAEQRMEVAKLELAMLTNKMKWDQENYKFEQEKQMLEKQILKIEVQIKIEQLKKLNPSIVINVDQ